MRPVHRSMRRSDERVRAPCVEAGERFTTGVCVMTSVLKKCVMGVGVAATLAATASPADAQYRYRHYRHHDNTGVAIGAGILGLGIGAAIASSNRGYYGNGYYSGYSDPYYGG